MPQTRARPAALACLVIAAAAPATAAPASNSPEQPAQATASPMTAPAKQPLMRFTFTDGSALTARLLASGPEGYVVRGFLGTATLPADRVASARPVPDDTAMKRQERRDSYDRAILTPTPKPAGAHRAAGHRRHSRRR